ncbi:hypothetical protein F5Y16DRAFT_407035 [Xylariaceae sp. FL0255]|nr:hypothetical protein F5Y16DRAFT_407035 [Xylariaceae sp. FL0255]
MGSQPEDTRALPDFSDPELIMTHPTEAEKEQTWRLNHGEWGGALDLEAYLQREPFLASTNLSSNGGMVHWILTDKDSPVHQRRILASMETIRKRVLYISPGASPGVVKEGLSYGIGSVYTYPQFRGKKYAARLLKELSVALPSWEKKTREAAGRTASSENGTKTEIIGSAQTDGHDVTNGSPRMIIEPNPTVSSALWSDIGKKFYASKGWPAYESQQLEFKTDLALGLCTSSLFEDGHCSKARSQTDLQEHHPELSLTLTPVTESNLNALCAADESQLRAEMSQRARQDPSRPVFAFAPDPDVFRWHWAREDFISPHVFPHRPTSTVKGMIATVSNNGINTDRSATSAADAQQTRMWVIWGRYYGKKAPNAGADPDAESNTLYILRMVIVSPHSSSASSEAATTKATPAQALAFRAILQSAQDAARSWSCGKVVLWNPSPLVRDLADQSGAEYCVRDREVDSIPSLMWYGDDVDGKEKIGVEVDWVANEKYCWC